MRWYEQKIKWKEVDKTQIKLFVEKIIYFYIYKLYVLYI